LVALELGDTCVEMLEEKDLDDPGGLLDRLQRAVLDGHHRGVVLDLWRLRDITSTVVAVLVGTEYRAATCGTPVAIACARPRVRQTLALLRKVLTIHGSVGLALEAMEQRGKETAMDEERTDDGRAEDAREAEGAGPAQVGPGAGPSPGEETKKITDEEMATLNGGRTPEPARELPESVMQHLRADAPSLADILKRKVETADKPVDTPVDSPVEKPVEKPADEPAEEPAEEPVDEPAPGAAPGRYRPFASLSLESPVESAGPAAPSETPEPAEEEKKPSARKTARKKAAKKKTAGKKKSRKGSGAKKGAKPKKKKAAKKSARK